MQDRPDLIQSELAGLAFDSLQQVFRKSDVEIAYSLEPIPATLNSTVWLVVDPAAGGPQSDYAIVSIYRSRGTVTVSVLCDYVQLFANINKLRQRGSTRRKQSVHGILFEVYVITYYFATVPCIVGLKHLVFHQMVYIEE